MAFSLALDAFAVSVSSGVSVRGFSWRDALRLGVWFGAFQFAMPLAGWMLGSSVSAYIEPIAPWIAFGLLAVIGGRMACDALRHKEADTPPLGLDTRRVALLALATSIDALAVGISMALMDIPVWTACAIIGVVAFALSVVGGLAGRKLGGLFQKRAELLGGLVLIGIGVNILIGK